MSLYKRVYNDNKYFHDILCYNIRRYIIINIYVIYESVSHVI